MENLLIWPSMPALSIATLVIVSMIFLYFAREPMQRLFKTLVEALAGGFNMMGRWTDTTALRIHQRNREVLLEAGMRDLEGSIEQEFERLQSAYAKGLKNYPTLHLQLDENVKKISSEYDTASELPPEAPGWSQAVEAIAKMQNTTGDRTVEKLLSEMHRSAVEGERRALKAYREGATKRQKILAALAPHWKAVQSLLEKVSRATSGVLERAQRIDGFMERYEQMRRGDDIMVRSLSSSSVKLFVISVVVLAIAVGAGFINFQIIALPMSELVPAGTQIAGMAVASLAALVIVLMEVAAGIFLLDALGITDLFPKLKSLPRSRRTMIAWVSFIGLFLLAAIESSLAILREQLVAADVALRQALAGVDAGAIAQVEASPIPMIGQAVLGFILPWLIAMVAVPLEMFIDSARHVAGKLAIMLVMLVGTLVRLLAYAMQYSILLVSHLYDAFIMIPLSLERAIRGKQAPMAPSLTSAELAKAAQAVSPVTVGGPPSEQEKKVSS